MSLNNNFINKYYLNNKLNRLMHDNEAQLSYFTCLWVTVCLQVGQILQAQHELDEVMFINVKGQKKATVSWRTPNRVNIK